MQSFAAESALQEVGVAHASKTIIILPVDDLHGSGLPSSHAYGTHLAHALMHISMIIRVKDYSQSWPARRDKDDGYRFKEAGLQHLGFYFTQKRQSRRTIVVRDL